jgi:hypothetical protein
MVFDVAGAATDVPVKRLRNRPLEFGARHRRLGETFQQNLRFVQESRGAIAALESKVIDEGLLQGGEFTAFRMAFGGPDRLSVERRRRDDLGLVSLVPSALSTMTAQLRHCAAPQRT